MPHPSQPKFDLARPSREGFRSISPKIWEEIGNKNYTGGGLEVGAGLEVEVGLTPHGLSWTEADHLAKVLGQYLLRPGSLSGSKIVHLIFIVI